MRGYLLFAAAVAALVSIALLAMPMVWLVLTITDAEFRFVLHEIEAFTCAGLGALSLTASALCAAKAREMPEDPIG